MPFKILNSAFVFFGSCASLESPEVAAFSGFGVYFA